jgi:deferrochelatase/peroxidase EfeB
MPHGFVTVVVPFEDRNADAVDAQLDRLGNPAGPRIAGPLDQSGFVHFLSVVVVRGAGGGAAHLVLQASADGHRRDVIARLAEEIGGPLCDVLGAAGIAVSPADLGAFLARRDRPVGAGWFSVPGVVFDGTPGMSVTRIRRERQLAADVRDRLERLRGQSSPLAVLGSIRAQLFAEGHYKWAFVPERAPLLEPAPKGWSFMRPIVWSALRTLLWPLLVLPALVLVVLGVFLGPLAAVLILGAELVLGGLAGFLAYRSLRRKERTDAEDPREVSAAEAGEVMDRENRSMQNELTAVSTMKPGRLRRLTLRVALWVIGAFAAHHEQPGTLRGIRTIHFARWILLPRTDTLVFFSDYSGSWESYLEDFIMRAHDGLTGVWSNTQGFPKTKNLVEDGATQAGPFKRWARRQQIPTRCWYSAYPDLSTHRIRTNSAIRHGLATASTEDEAARWLAHFGFPSPPPRPPLAVDDIPALVFTGFRRLPFGHALLLQLPVEPAPARDWLRAIEPDVAYGEGKRQGSTLVLGLSASGFRKLGLGAQALSTFAIPFQQGMDVPWRSRALGDEDDNAPTRWLWGSGERRADAILNVYAASDDDLKEALARRMDDLERLGLTVIHDIRLQPVPPKNGPVEEPFGFADGISQPIVRGASKSVIERNQIHVVEPGEMVLGYPDNLDQLPPSPHDGPTDLGGNGTYLVVRQLEQNAQAFIDYLKETADRLMGDPRVPRELTREQLVAWIGAKMVGRWPDGTSLVRHPHRPGTVGRPGVSPDNDFLFGTEDPDGLRCPFGAHIRRVNPRDTFEAGSKEQLQISNRHRILRVGRRYAAQNRSPHPGLLFMCLNANLERQFEFMQQTYMLGSSFHGLENEVDSFARNSRLSGVLTIPTENGPLRLQSIPSFVKVLGGAYFFMPGRTTLRRLAGA